MNNPKQEGANDNAQSMEITAEMVEAGVEVAWSGPFEFPTDKNLGEMVRKIFVAMLRTR
jgi:hypothetical protein